MASVNKCATPGYSVPIMSGWKRISGARKRSGPILILRLSGKVYSTVRRAERGSVDVGSLLVVVVVVAVAVAGLERSFLFLSLSAVVWVLLETYSGLYSDHSFSSCLGSWAR